MTDSVEKENASGEVVELTPAQLQRQNIRHMARYFYDLQGFRIMQANRAGKQGEGSEAELNKGQKAFLERQAEVLHKLEKEAVKELKKALKGYPVYEEWLVHQKGIGPALAGVLVAEIDIHRARYASSIHHYAGVACDTNGAAMARKKGQKITYNPFLKAKLLKVMGDCLLRANSGWRKHYDERKHRRQHQSTVCALCGHTDTPGKYEGKTCYNCNGDYRNAPWGKSDAHRHRDAIRYMVKHFLSRLYEVWRPLEGLEVHRPYAEAHLGRVHSGEKFLGDEPKEK